MVEICRQDLTVDIDGTTKVEVLWKREYLKANFEAKYIWFTVRDGRCLLQKINTIITKNILATPQSLLCEGKCRQKQISLIAALFLNVLDYWISLSYFKPSRIGFRRFKEKKSNEYLVPMSISEKAQSESHSFAERVGPTLLKHITTDDRIVDY